MAVTAAALLKEWSSIPAIDHHCHPLRRWPFTLTAPELRAAFSEAIDPRLAEEHIPYTAAYQGTLRRIARELGCEPDEKTVLERRNAIDPQDYARHGFRASATGMMLVDTGFASSDSFTLEQQAKALEIPQLEVVRLETMAEGLVASASTPADWFAAVRGALESAVKGGAVGLKTICAYRASLRLKKPDPDELARTFQDLRQQAADGKTPRLSANPLCHALLFAAAAECVRLDIPLQVHCGFGDPDEDLAETSPLGLRPLFIDPAYRGLRIALLHCYPYHREAAYLCSVFPDVYMDLSLTIPFAALDGARAMREALGLCPTSKLLYASDASRYPEVYFVAASCHREALADAFSELIERDVFGPADAIEAGRHVLAENARAVYRLGGS